MRTWRNWYTRSLEEAVPQGVEVQVLSSALTYVEGRLAQLVERRIYTANVGGSSPSSSTELPKNLIFFFLKSPCTFGPHAFVEKI